MTAQKRGGSRPEPAGGSGGLIGSPLLRLEDDMLVTGSAQFVADLRASGMLSAGFVRSPFAHAALTAVDTGAAGRSPGIVSVFTAADLDLPEIPSDLMRIAVDPAMSRPPLARNRVRYAGEPVAIVVGETPYQVADAVGLVQAEYEELEPVTDPDDSLRPGAPRLFESTSNLVHRRDEEAPREKDKWPVSVSVQIENPRLAAVTIEPLGLLVVPEPDGSITVWCSHQSPHNLMRQLSQVLGLEEDLIRVRVPAVGGAFGLKGMLYPEYIAVVGAARRLNRPVMWVQSRREHMAGGNHGRGQRTRITLEGELSGRIRRVDVHVLADVGAYPQSGLFVPMSTLFMAPGPYDIRDVSATLDVVVTNRAPTGPYRGAGRPEAAYALERAVDAFARQVGSDPAEIRRLNLIGPDEMPYTSATGAVYDGGHYAEALDRVLQLIDEPAVRAEQQRRRAAGENPIGLGMAVFVDRAGGGNPQLGEYAHVEIGADGTATVHTGSTSAGQSHETVWAQVASDALGLPIEGIEIVAGDTGRVARGYGSYGSRSAQYGASAVFRMATSVREQARRIAAELLEADPADIVLDAAGFGIAGVPGTSVGYGEIAARAAEVGESLVAEEDFVPGSQTFPYGAYAAVVEVDIETGVVRLVRFAAVDDCGNVINPLVVEGQIHGAIMQGLGQALIEGIEYDERGQLLTSSLMDYPVPTALDAPELLTDRLTTPAPSNPLGVKGVGESGTIGAPPAVVGAVLNALAPWEVTDLTMPLRPDRVWAAVHRPDSR